MDASPFLYSESSPVELKVTQCNSMEYSVCILGVAYSNACACRRLCHDLWVLVPQLCGLDREQVRGVERLENKMC